MLSLINRFRIDERGATATEYAMLIVFIALAIAVGAQAFSTGLNDLFTKMGTTISGVSAVSRPRKHRVRGRSGMDTPFPTPPPSA